MGGVKSSARRSTRAVAQTIRVCCINWICSSNYSHFRWNPFKSNANAYFAFLDLYCFSFWCFANKGLRVTVDTSKIKTLIFFTIAVQHEDQDIWSNFCFFQNKRIFEKNQTLRFSPKPTLNTIINQSCAKICSSYVVSNPTLTYSKAQTWNYIFF